MNHANFTTEFVLETRNFRDPWFWLPLGIMMLCVLLSLCAPVNRHITVFLNHTFANQSALADQLWLFISMFTEGAIILPLVLSLCLVRPHLLLGYVMTILTSSLLVLSFSILADMSGPTVALKEQIITVGQYASAWSFPSVQVTWTVSALGFLFFHNKRTWLRILLLVSILLVTASRVVLGAHWVLDVTVAAFIGWLCAYGGFLIVLSIPLILPKLLLYGLACINFALGIYTAVFYSQSPLFQSIPQYTIATVIVGFSLSFLYKLTYSKTFLHHKSTYH